MHAAIDIFCYGTHLEVEGKPAVYQIDHVQAARMANDVLGAVPRMENLPPIKNDGSIRLSWQDTKIYLELNVPKLQLAKSQALQFAMALNEGIRMVVPEVARRN